MSWLLGSLLGLIFGGVIGFGIGVWHGQKPMELKAGMRIKGRPGESLEGLRDERGEP